MKIHSFLFMGIVAATVGAASAQTYTWDTALITSAGNSDYISDMVVDSSGNSYQVGYQYDGVNNDGRITKFDSSGAAQFTTRYERTFMDTLASQNEFFISAAENGGSIYAMGKQYNGSNYDILLVKYSTSGTSTWIRSYDAGATDEPAKGLAVDGSGNMYILFTRTSGGSTSLRMAKYDTSGSRLWTNTYALSGGAQADFLRYDPVNGVLYGLSATSGGYNLSRFNTSGTKIWTTYVAATQMNDMRIDSAGNIILAKVNTSGTPYLEIVKYTSAGSLSWSYSTGFTAGDIVAYSLTSDSSNNVYMGGYRGVGTGWNSILTSVDSTGAFRFQVEDSTNQFQLFYKVAIAPSGDLYGAYSHNTTPGSTSISTIRQFSTSGTLLAERSSSFTADTNWCYTLGFDGSGGVYAGGGIYQWTGTLDQKFYVAKF